MISWIEGKGWDNNDSDWGGLDKAVSSQVFVLLSVNLMTKRYELRSGFEFDSQIDIVVLRDISIDTVDFGIKGIGTAFDIDLSLKASVMQA